MSRFDILRSEFDRWHEQAWAVQVAWRRLPYVLADAVKIYLGAPDTFSDLSIAEKPQKHSYVAPADASWNSGTLSFDLMISQRGALMQDFELHEKDGRYYFGMVVYLDKDANTFPKQPFWFLFSVGWGDENSSLLRIQRTGQDFSIPTSIYSREHLEPVCEAIEKLLRMDLAVSPYARRDENTASPHSRNPQKNA